MCSATLALWLCLASPNLLDNGGFELAPTPGSPPEGWTTWAPAGVTIVQDESVAHGGRASLRIDVAAGTEIQWYQAHRPVQPIRRGATYTLSAWIRTRDARDGSGAYLSLNAYDGNGTRIGVFDSERKVSGATDWTRVTTTAAVPDGTSELRAIVTLHGHGTAWFDEAQAEEGTLATPFQPSITEERRTAKLLADKQTAAVWLEALPARRAGQARAAVLDLGLGARRTATAQPSDPAVLAEALRAAGLQAVVINGDQVGNTAFLHPGSFDLLVVPTGDEFPAAAREALTGYLARGGLLLTTGGYAFDRQVVPYQGKWIDPAKVPAGNAPATAIFGPGTAGWTASTNRDQKPTLEAVTGPGGTTGIAVATPSLAGWDTVVSPSVAGKLPADWAVTRFWARGDARTERMWVEWSEADGARWHKAIELTPEWKEYFLYPGDFLYWHDNPSVGRGGKSDRFNPQQAERFQYGVATDIAAKGEPHRVEVAGVRVQADPFAAIRVAATPLNTRFAPIRDAMWPEPEQIGAFDPGFPLREVAKTTAAPGQDVVAGYALDGALSGYAATAMLGLQGHGFGPNRARCAPLLASADKFGRPRGPAAALVHQFTGTYRGSSWAILGVSDRDLFPRGGAALKTLFVPTVQALVRRLYLHETTTSYASYRPGETVLLRTRVSSFGAAERAVEVRFVVGDAGTDWRRIRLPSGATVDVEQPWPLPPAPRDYYPFRAELRLDGQRIDQEPGAFCVRSPEVLARGPKLTSDGTRFRLDGGAQFLMGCQSYWGQNGSYTARSPLAFERDFGTMQAHGLRWTRLFMPFRTEEDKRVSDAVVQLAQKHGLVLYHTPNLVNTADEAILAEQAATSREIAERYRGVPGLAVDICNEPTMRADDPALVKAAGGGAKLTGPFDDLGITSFWKAAMRLQRAWAKSNLDAIHAGDPDRLASVGWSQGYDGWETMKDPITASLDLDFTDRHYYGRPEGLPPELRDLDLRGLGKPLVLGECGAKDHPTYKLEDPWGMGDDDTSFDRRFLYLAHHAYGMGAAVMSSWHWRDPMEGIFPCGLAYSTGVPKPTAAIYRAMAIAFGALKPVDAKPEVVLLLPDEGRMSGQREVTIGAFHRADELLTSARVDFTCLPDSAIDRLPPSTKAVLWPAPPAASDAVIDGLVHFAQRGGAIYLSGDPALDADHRTLRPEHLRKLCAGGPVGEPVRGVTEFRLGPGRVWWTAQPPELAPALAPEHRALYCRFLEAAGVARLPVTPDTAELHAFRVAGEDADAWVFYNAGTSAVTAEVAGCRLELAADKPGWLLLGHDGTLRGVEAQGRVEQGGKLVATIAGHAFILAQDGRGLADSSDVLVMPVAAAEVTWATHATRLTAALVERRGTAWATLAPATVKVAGGNVTAAIPAGSRDIVWVTAHR